MTEKSSVSTIYRPDGKSGKTYLFLGWVVWGSIPEPIKSSIRCQQFAIAATLTVWALAQSRGDGHRSLVTPKRVLCEYNKHLIFSDNAESYGH